MLFFYFLVSLLAFTWVMLNSGQTFLVYKNLLWLQFPLSLVVSSMWVFIVKIVVEGGWEVGLSYAIGAAIGVTIATLWQLKITRSRP